MNLDNANHKRITGLLAAAAPDFGVEIVSAAGRETAGIETAMSRWGQGLGYGVIVPSDPRPIPAEDSSLSSQRAIGCQPFTRCGAPSSMAV